MFAATSRPTLPNDVNDLFIEQVARRVATRRPPTLAILARFVVASAQLRGPSRTPQTVPGSRGRQRSCHSTTPPASSLELGERNEINMTRSPFRFAAFSFSACSDGHPPLSAFLNPSARYSIVRIRRNAGCSSMVSEHGLNSRRHAFVITAELMVQLMFAAHRQNST